MRKLMRGDIIPWGISVREQGLYIKIPYFVWKSAHYDITIDEFVYGWRILGILLKVNAGSVSIGRQVPVAVGRQYA